MAEGACGADLVVMATHGRTGLRRAVLGSVAGSRSAVLAVRSGALVLRLPELDFDEDDDDVTSRG